MNTLKAAATVMLLIAFGACAPRIYKAPNFEGSKEIVKTIAILPFDVSINNRKVPKGTTGEMLKGTEEKTGYEIQDRAYSWLLRRSKNFTVAFQDVDRTNSLLKSANLDYKDIFRKDKGQLCKFLGVDAVISGKAIMSKPMSEGAAIAVGLLVGAWGATNKTTTMLTIHDAGSGLLWRYDYDASGSVGSSPENLANALMRNASKRFPYKVKK